MERSYAAYLAAEWDRRCQAEERPVRRVRRCTLRRRVGRWQRPQPTLAPVQPWEACYGMEGW